MLFSFLCHFRREFNHRTLNVTVKLFSLITNLGTSDFMKLRDRITLLSLVLMRYTITYFMMDKENSIK